MTARVLAALRLIPRSQSATPRAAAVSRRRAARLAVWSGVAAFALLTAALAVALETVKPEWRDPEFALRLKQLRRWKALAPDRPLVVVLGSSRTQMGIAPAAMGFPDAPGSPVVYNCGYRSGRILAVYLNLRRVLDAGIRPAAVVVQLAPVELMVTGTADRQYRGWAPRLALADHRRWAEHTADPNVFRLGWVRSRANPWETYRAAVRSDLAPGLHTAFQRVELTWELMDQYGFAPSPFPAIPDEVRRINRQDVRRQHGKALAAFAPTADCDRVLRDVVSLCRAEGIPVALSWAPESPSCHTLYTPASRAAVRGYGDRLAAELGVPVFPEPDDLAELDFADGFHLLKPGAEKYSRWLAEHHLKPWFAAQGVGP